MKNKQPNTMSNNVYSTGITKQEYDSICVNAINNHHGGYFKDNNENPLEPGKEWPFVTVPRSPVFNKSIHPPPPPPGRLYRTFASERIPSETFVEELCRTTKENLTRIEKNNKCQKNFDEKLKHRYNELMIILTDKYYRQLVSCLKYNAKNGKNEAYMNFVYEDFKANMPTMGKPKEIQRKWLKEMQTPDSIYLQGRRSLTGIVFDCWGNGAFTVRFTW